MNGPAPLAVLIGALGGEGGGVLSGWLVQAARRTGLAVQATSIPGVSQRTGATTYYVEICPQPLAELGGRRPVFGLHPVAGAIDAVIASELVEAGRAMSNGFVTPSRTTLIAAVHRVYATSEKMQMGDGRADAARLLDAARALPRRAILFDPKGDAAVRRLPLNAVLLGVLAGAGVVPIAEEAFAAAIRDSGIAVAANLEGFDWGLRLGRGEVAAPPRHPEAPPTDVVALGVARLTEYQDPAYARLYLARLEPLRGADPAVFAETARHLALWMSYEDVIRVADLKTRRARLEGVRAEVQAREGEPLRVVEYMKPGVDEVAAVLPAALGRRLRRWGEGRRRLYLPLRLATTSITGFLLLRLVARLKPWRRRSLRFVEEQASIERWLDAIARAAPAAPRLALEIAGLARLLKGYGDTQTRGRRNFERVMERVVEPALRAPDDAAAATVAAARDAALADAEGTTLARTLAAE